MCRCASTRSAASRRFVPPLVPCRSLASSSRWRDWLHSSVLENTLPACTTAQQAVSQNIHCPFATHSSKPDKFATASGNAVQEDKEMHSEKLSWRALLAALADNHVETVIAQVEGLGRSLHTITDDSKRFVLQDLARLGHGKFLARHHFSRPDRQAAADYFVACY